MAKRRAFTQREKRALGLVGGVSTDGMHADHIVPYAAGGATDVANGQLLTPRANNRKGAAVLQLREWQEEFILRWDQRVSGKPFLLSAIPGGGKTIAALEVARRWMRAGNDRRLLVVVPTNNLQEQWKDEAAAFGIELQTREFGSCFKHGYAGAVLTYQTVAVNSVVVRALCGSAPTLVVLDEPHHCGESKQWGDGVQHGCEPSVEKLLLSGTPWRTTGERIPFVDYDDKGWAKVDYPYDYPKALKDNVVRYLSFRYDRGRCKVAVNGKEHIYEMHSGISDEDAQRTCRHLLNPAGDFLPEIIRIADAKLREVRHETPDAAAMAACMDQSHAERVAEVIYRETGKKPVVIVSDNEVATGTVREFRNSRDEWLVSVRQVSEGTDIKRLQVLCYLTNFATPLFFRQLIGRVSRVRGENDLEAHVFLPADPRLIQHAQEIEQLQYVAYKQQAEELRERRERDASEPSNFQFLDSEHDGTEFVQIAGELFSQQQHARIAALAGKSGLTLEQTVRFLKAQAEIDGQPARDAAPPIVPREDREKELRRECNAKAFHFSKLAKCDVEQVHSQFRPQKHMTIEELEDKKRRLELWITETTR